MRLIQYYESKPANHSQLVRTRTEYLDAAISQKLRPVTASQMF